MDEKKRKPEESVETPTPPQVMDPRQEPGRDEQRSDASNTTTPKGDAEKRPETGDQEKPKKEPEKSPKDETLLSETGNLIDDETTI